jgi:signal transduction histidine kinase
VTRWPRWSESVRSAVLVAAVVVVGLFAEWRSVGFSEPGLWLPDLTVGVALAGVGAALRLRGDRRMGSLMVAAGLAWFAGNFAEASSEWLSWGAVHLRLVHRAIIFAALAMFPVGRVHDRLERMLIVVAFAGVLVDLADNEWWTIGWATSLVAVYAVVVRRRTAFRRTAGFLVLPVMVVFSTVLVSVSAMLLVVGAAGAPRIAVLTYQAGVVVTAVLLVLRASEWQRRTMEVADAVVELTFGPASNVRDLLSQALRDPSVEVVFATPDDSGRNAGWVDEVGCPVTSLSSTGRAVVPIMVDGQLAAEVASNVDFDALPMLLEAVESATRLAAKNARLRSSLRREIDLLAASRLRLLSAADQQRAALADQLEREAGQTLVRMRHLLEGIAPGADQAVEEAAKRSITRLQGLEGDLHSLAAGLGPTVLTRGGLTEALNHLADGGSVPITVAVDTSARVMPPATARTIYFVCAEGISNAVKHATASSVHISLKSTGDRWVLMIVDDGCGGADRSTGSGLQNIADRVSALGGHFDVTSSIGAGTRLTVELPCG